MDTKVLITDPAKCNGCKECQIACSRKHTGLETGEQSRIHVLQAGSGDFYLPITCQHCESPSCMAVCPEGAIYKDEDEWKTLLIPVEDIQRDVLVKIPKLDLFAKTK